MNRKQLQRAAERGFTLIELLIVVVIIGILAAVAIPQFNDTKESAYDATAKSDLRNLMSHQEHHFYQYGLYASELSASGSADSSTVVFAGSSDMAIGQNIDITGGGGTGTPLQFTAQARHPSSDNCWEVSIGRNSSSTNRIEQASSCSLGGGN